MSVVQNSFITNQEKFLPEIINEILPKFDSESKVESFKLFYLKILDGTLEMRKTEDPCHAKMYLFEYNDLVNDIKGKVFAKISLDNISSFPIPETSIEAQQPFVDLAIRILEAKTLVPKADTSAFENEVDLMVYRLYGLTYEEVLIIDSKIPITQQQYEQ